MRSVGFIGVGLMGSPIAENLLRAGNRVTVWNRSRDRSDRLRDCGARVARDLDALFDTERVILMMLAHQDAIDDVLRRGTPWFDEAVRDRVLVNVGTVAPHYSQRLARDIEAAGGDYLEAPVSGSRVPAERGELVAMTAGKAECIELVRPLLDAFCSAVYHCGDVPNAALMKLAVNVFLITQVTGLAEAFNLARHAGLDLTRFTEILNSGQMASAISRVKLRKLLDADFSPQAAIADVYRNSRLISETAANIGCATPLLDSSESLLRAAADRGLDQSDMIGVIEAIGER